MAERIPNYGSLEANVRRALQNVVKDTDGRLTVVETDVSTLQTDVDGLQQLTERMLPPIGNALAPWVTPVVVGGTIGASASLPTNRVVSVPLYLPAGTYTTVGLNVTTSGAGVVGCSVYEFNASGYHGTKIADTTTTIDVSATGERTTTFDTALTWTGGWVLVAFASNIGSVQVTSVTAGSVLGMRFDVINAYAASASYGVFKSTGDTSPNGSDPTSIRNSAPLFGIK